MRASTKHAIAHRLVALIGCIIFIGPLWDIPGLTQVNPLLVLLGLLLLWFGLLSSAGVGPWGRHYKSLYIAEHKASLK